MSRVGWPRRAPRRPSRGRVLAADGQNLLLGLLQLLCQRLAVCRCSLCCLHTRKSGLRLPTGGTGACQVQHGGSWQGLQECAKNTVSLRDACAMLGIKGSVRGYHAQVVALSGNVLELPLISGAAGNPSEGCATEGPRAGRETQSSDPAPPKHAHMIATWLSRRQTFRSLTVSASDIS